MSILDNLKKVFTPENLQTAVAQIPAVIQTGEQIAANPSIPGIVEALAQLVENEVANLHSKLDQTNQAVSQMSAVQPGQSSDAIAAPVVATPEQVAQIVEKVLEAINPKLEALAPVLELIARHFPNLQTAQ